MILAMANENMQEWDTDMWIDQETVSAVVHAFHRGEIVLEKPDYSKGGNPYPLRNAPSFIRGKVTSPGPLTYTSESVNKFLGWDKLARTRAALNSLEAEVELM